MVSKRRPLLPDEPLLHADHKRPITRRDFLRYAATHVARAYDTDLLDRTCAHSLTGRL